MSLSGSLGEHPLKRDSDLALKDNYPLLYAAKKNTRFSRKKDADYNAKGFGAGGLLPLSFSHLNRNWKSASSQHARMLEDSQETGTSVCILGYRCIRIQTCTHI